MKALIYGGLALWLMSLSVWAYGELFAKDAGTSEGQGRVVAAAEADTGSDGLEDDAESDRKRRDARPLRLEGFSKEDQSARLLTPWSSTASPRGTSGTEEPL